jgi:drug/metabolite transporter (DMT)-like permease
MAWGTFEPAVRLVYQYQPSIPPLVFSLAYYLAAATVLVLLSLRSLNDNNRLASSRQSFGGVPESNAVLPVWGGIELGTYLFVGNALQVIGLKTVPSDRAAFLLQLTTVFVPLVQSLLAQNLSIVPVRTWFACIVALGGVGLIGFDGSKEIDGELFSSTAEFSLTFLLNNLDFSPGDFYVILGALFYTFHCIRLELYARTTSAIQLAATKATTEAVWSGLVILICLLAVDFNPAQNPVMDLAKTSGNNILAYARLTSSEDAHHWFQVGLATLWTGLVTVAYTIYAQSFGQARVPAAKANLIYTIQPFFTALIAYLVLGEQLSAYGYAGGVLIGGAVLLVVAEDENT